jgi:hypothetical protein
MGQPTTLKRAKWQIARLNKEIELLTKIAYMSDHQLAKAHQEERQAFRAYESEMDSMGETNYCRGSYLDSLEQAISHRLLAK